MLSFLSVTVKEDLLPIEKQVVGDLVLWNGPLGKSAGGAHPDLHETVNKAFHGSRTHVECSMRATAVMDEEVAEFRTRAISAVAYTWLDNTSNGMEVSCARRAEWFCPGHCFQSHPHGWCGATISVQVVNGSWMRRLPDWQKWHLRGPWLWHDLLMADWSRTISG